jgi:hypothetical protein
MSKNPRILLLSLLPLMLAGFAQADDYASPGPFAAGRTDVTVTRSNGTSFLATVHYPALSSGVNAPFDPSGGPYPIVSFGHGFLQPVSQYRSTLAHLASQSNGGFAPSHAGFAADLRFRVDWLVAQGAPGGMFAGAMASDRIAFAGHSMGGGSALPGGEGRWARAGGHQLRGGGHESQFDRGGCVRRFADATRRRQPGLDRAPGDQRSRCTRTCPGHGSSARSKGASAAASPMRISSSATPARSRGRRSLRRRER